MKNRTQRPAQHDQLLEPRIGGQALSANVRDTLEPRFNHSLANVRIYPDDPRAAAFDAHAFAVGSQIGFRNGAYQPDTPQGMHVLAHEIAHVVQNERYGVSKSQHVSQYGDPSERDAHRAASSVMIGGMAGVSSAPSAAVARISENELGPLPPVAAAQPWNADIMAELSQSPRQSVASHPAASPATLQTANAEHSTSSSETAHHGEHHGPSNTERLLNQWYGENGYFGSRPEDGDGRRGINALGTAVTAPMLALTALPMAIGADELSHNPLAVVGRPLAPAANAISNLVGSAWDHTGHHLMHSLTGRGSSESHGRQSVPAEPALTESAPQAHRSLLSGFTSPPLPAARAQPAPIPTDAHPALHSRPDGTTGGHSSTPAPANRSEPNWMLEMSRRLRQPEP